MTNDFLAGMVQNAANEKGYPGVMALSEAVKEIYGINYERVSKVWKGLYSAKIGDYIIVMEFLESDIVVPLKTTS